MKQIGVWLAGRDKQLETNNAHLCLAVRFVQRKQLSIAVSFEFEQQAEIADKAPPLIGRRKRSEKKLLPPVFTTLA
ncbi:hypothetical protein T01_14410 [Trichinella spiralis]|uniref:Uncharacterized protein n=1 Tax=Trichinella spiralis TaxID=6334 RepID=A0A0V1BJ52_TRISP|nr:hypothetical protein T01_14410 [Trichinella spiralis]